ncbi:MAG: GNAT family N-acetyltransferase [Nocardioidaceae bacterium]
MQFRQLDVHDDAAFDAFYATHRAGTVHERPHAAYWSRREAALFFRRPSQEVSPTAWLAYDGGRPVGAALGVLPQLDNRHMFFLGLATVPDARGRGLGSALLDVALAEAKGQGRDTVIADGNYPVNALADHPVRRFAERHGFALANTELHRVCELPVPEQLLDRLAREAAGQHRDYELRSFTGAVPEELLASYVANANQLVVDAPTGDIDFEASGLTPGAQRERELLYADQGRTPFVTVAVDPDGQVVAHTVLVTPPAEHDPDNAYQWATMVARGHRGHRLGMAVKVANLRALQRDQPERVRVHTSNAEVNRPMVAINEVLGFGVVEVNAEFQRRL